MQVPSEDRRLSRRESEVLGLLCLGLTDKEAAEQLGVAMGTVRVYRKRSEAKNGAKGLIQTALVAWRLGFIDLEAIADKLMAECVGSGPGEPNTSRPAFASSTSEGAVSVGLYLAASA